MFDVAELASFEVGELGSEVEEASDVRGVKLGGRSLIDDTIVPSKHDFVEGSAITPVVLEQANGAVDSLAGDVVELARDVQARVKSGSIDIAENGSDDMIVARKDIDGALTVSGLSGYAQSGAGRMD